MQEVYVSQDILHRMMYDTITRSAMALPTDVKAALRNALDGETSALGKMHLETTLRSLELGEETEALACADTGWPLYYIKSGDNVRIEGGFSTLYEVSKRAVAEATENGKLRENMVQPLTRRYTGDNTGLYIPKVELRFDGGIDYLEVIGIAKGGGSELYGTFYRMLDPVDGQRGVIKFILDSVKEATYAGKACGPNIIGVGIGGTADLCMRMAKDAALLRPVGDRHPEAEIAEMEVSLIDAIKAMNRGPMGTGGVMGVLDVHIEYAVTHSAMLPVGFQMECCIARRAIARYGPGARIEYDDRPDWKYR
jgi:tartrate/fumarate subfamily iron-sulfur-dependent hydro-lyase alpha chain